MAFKTIHTVTYPSEAHVIKLQLETEGIDVFLKDELTVQTDNFISNAIGGVKIQVPEEDYETAGSILIQLGYVNMESRNDGFIGSIDQLTKKIPIVKNWGIIARLVSFTLAMILAFFVLIYALIPK
ncbi:MAG: DUF2007 domain-containing protein [Flavobacteriales bacterium]